MTASLWHSLSHDPRVSANAALRASDSDRDLVSGVLAAAYAEGRLDREEHDQRAETAAAARTLGEFPPLVADLVPETTPSKAVDPIAGASPAQLRHRADLAWQERRRSAVLGFVAPTVVCWAIYLAVNGGFDAFMWPLIVMAVTAVNLLRTVANGDTIRREELRRLEKQQAKAQRKRGWLP